MRILHEFTGGGPAQSRICEGIAKAPKWKVYFDPKTGLSAIYGFTHEKRDGDNLIRVFTLHDIVTLEEAHTWMNDHQYETLD